MTDITIEMLVPARVAELWSYLEPLFEEAAVGNEIAKDEMDAAYVRRVAETGEAVIFCGMIDNKPVCTVGIQFHMANGHRGADLIALAGKHLITFKRRYWKSIIEWLKANEIEFLDAYVPAERAMLYTNKFGFDKSCAYMRMSLGAHR